MRTLRLLWDLVPSLNRRPTLKTALTTLDREVDRLGDQLTAKSLIGSSVA